MYGGVVSISYRMEETHMPNNLPSWSSCELSVPCLPFALNPCRFSCERELRVRLGSEFVAKKWAGCEPGPPKDTKGRKRDIRATFCNWTVTPSGPICAGQRRITKGHENKGEDRPA